MEKEREGEGEGSRERREPAGCMVGMVGGMAK